MADITPWIIGLAVTVQLAVAGWLIAASKAKQANIYANGLSRVKEQGEAITQIGLDLAVIKTEGSATAAGVKDLRALLEKHLDTLHPRRKQ